MVDGEGNRWGKIMGNHERVIFPSLIFFSSSSFDPKLKLNTKFIAKNFAGTLHLVYNFLLSFVRKCLTLLNERFPMVSVITRIFGNSYICLVLLQ